MCVIPKAIKMNKAMIWFYFTFNFRTSSPHFLQIPLQSAQQKLSTVRSDSGNRKQQCMQPGNGLPSERTGGPVKDEMTVICLGRQWKDVHFSKSDQIIP